MFNRIYLGVGAIILALYAYVGVTGWEFSSPARVHAAGDSRHSPGGRGSSFWYSGIHGGK